MFYGVNKALHMANPWLQMCSTRQWWTVSGNLSCLETTQSTSNHHEIIHQKWWFQ